MSDEPPSPDGGKTPIPQSQRPHRTASQVDERISFCRDLLARQVHKATIKAKFRKEYGKTNARTFERYLSRAHARVESDRAKGRDLLRDDCRDTLDWVIREATDKREVVAAIQAKAKILGLELSLPPVEKVAEQLGMTVEQFYAMVASNTGRTLSDPAPAHGHPEGPHQVPD